MSGKETGDKILGGIDEYGALIVAILEKLGPVTEAAQAAFGKLFDKLRTDERLTPEAHAALLSRLDSLDAAIARA